MGDNPQRLNRMMLEVAVNAAGAGHNLTAFYEATGRAGVARGWWAVCRGCGHVVVVCADGMAYSFLPAACPGRRRADQTAAQ